MALFRLFAFRSALALAVAVMLTGRASALPIFAHRYGFTCGQCHTTVPNLNSFGIYFRQHGFRLDGGRGTLPLAIKAQLAYASDGGSGTGAAPLPKAFVDEIELLSAGSIGRNASYFVEQYVVDGGFSGRPRDVWVQFDRQLTGRRNAPGAFFHARLGQFTLPLPVDPETQRPTISHYLIFDQSIGGNAFTFFDPRIGADLSYTDDRRGFEAHAVLAKGVDRTSGLANQGLDVMGALSQSVGGAVTAYVYRFEGRRPLGPTIDRFYRQGYGAEYTHGRFAIDGVAQQNGDSSGDGLGRGEPSSGGFLQSAWHFNPGLSILARYDAIYDRFVGRQGAGTISLVLRPARNMRFTVEGTRSNDANQFASQLLFAY